MLPGQQEDDHWVLEYDEVEASGSGRQALPASPVVPKRKPGRPPLPPGQRKPSRPKSNRPIGRPRKYPKNIEVVEDDNLPKGPINSLDKCLSRVIAKTSLKGFKDTITQALNNVEKLARFNTGLDIERDIAQFLLDSRNEFMSRFEKIIPRRDDEMMEENREYHRHVNKKSRISDSESIETARLRANEDQNVIEDPNVGVDDIMELDVDENDSTIRASSRGQHYVISDDDDSASLPPSAIPGLMLDKCSRSRAQYMSANENSASLSRPAIPGLKLEKHPRPRRIELGLSTKGTRYGMGSQSHQREKTHSRTIPTMYQAYGSSVMMPQLPTRESEVEHRRFSYDDAPRSGYTPSQVGRSIANTDVGTLGQRPNKASALPYSKVPAGFDIKTAGTQGFLQDEVPFSSPVESRKRQDSRQPRELERPRPQYDPLFPSVDLSALLKQYGGTSREP